MAILPYTHIHEDSVTLHPPPKRLLSPFKTGTNTGKVPEQAHSHVPQVRAPALAHGVRVWRRYLAHDGVGTSQLPYRRPLAPRAAPQCGPLLLVSCHAPRRRYTASAEGTF